MSKESLKHAWYHLARFLCLVFTAIFFRLRARGRQNVPRRGSVVLAGNHQSFMDPVFCGVGVRRRLTYIARESLFHFGPFGWLIHSVNAIPIGRDKADIAAMRAILERLRRGEAVCLYPEGTRSHDGRIAPLKAGFGLLCRRSKATVVPVLVDGAFECWPRHRKLFRPGHVTIWYGTPLPPEQIAGMSNEQLADYLTQVLRRMQHECRLQQGKKPYEYDDGSTSGS